MIDRRAFAFGLAAATAASPVFAQRVPEEVQAELGSPRLLGSGRLRFLGLHVYDARLWSTQPLAGADWPTRALALEIEYARRLDGRSIAERSLDEMRRQREIAGDTAERWLVAMTSLFPDVKAGDRLTGVQRPGEGARFFANGAPRGDLRDPEFARLFFGIWLSEQSSQPALRSALLGGTK
jgi:Chalcone isomerase-like